MNAVTVMTMQRLFGPLSALAPAHVQRGARASSGLGVAPRSRAAIAGAAFRVDASLLTLVVAQSVCKTVSSSERERVE